jgi:7-cyano-7-deazaguanine synthase in queuosine biosynthesis
MNELISKLLSNGCGNMKINTLQHYYHIYLKFLYYHQIEKSKMQCYSDVAEDLGISERTVITAINICIKLKV